MNQKQRALPYDYESNGSERISDSIKSLVDSSCARKVLSLQTAIKDKKVIICSDGSAAASGCNYASSAFTVEAFDHERKIRLHRQLKLARKLRCQMEDAASEAKKAGNSNDAKVIFLERREDILELASLTNAVLGGYTLESYREYIDFEKDREDREKQRFDHSQGELNKLRERMLWESSPQTLIQQYNSNRRRRNASTAQTASSLNQPVTSSPKRKLTKRQLDMKYKKPEKQKDPTINQSTNENTNTPSGVMTTLSPSKKPSPLKKPSPSKKPSPTNLVKTKAAIPHEIKPPTICKTATSTNPSRTSRYQSTTTTIAKSSKKAPKSKLKRKCHYCKETVMDYSVCNYWFINGNKCKKIFCKSCLGRFKETSSDASDWHCPSCTRKCDCPVCVKDREREEVRASKRRRTARTDFSMFN